jgi:DedD protein
MAAPTVRNDPVTTNIPPRPEGEFTSRIVPIPTRAEGEAKAGQSPARESVPPPAAPGGEEAPPAAAVSPPATQEGPAAGGDTPPAGKDTAPPAKAGEAVAKSAAKPDAKSAAKSAGAPEHVGLTAWVVQLGSFASEENARTLNERLRKKGYSAFVEPVRQDGEEVYRVRVGPELLRSEAQALREKIRAETELEGIVVGYP